MNKNTKENINEIVNCSFTNNSAFYGGSIYLDFPGGLRIENCSFENNNAVIGSGIYFIQESNFILFRYFFYCFALFLI